MALDTWRINLKILRNKLGKNQSYIASIVDKTQQTIGNWESGIGEPNIDELIKITNLFGISLDDFIKIKQTKSSSPEIQGNILHEPQENYSSTGNIVQTLSLAIRGLDAANILLQNKVLLLEEANTLLKKRR
ncbi:MAG TPA: helix-turn-helix transcriptional regulator [Ferruginibacter sp.]|nr:helix-turn-helix transcriptional regulator [Ferruginibacter sp.]